jgi:hypothetical protein
MVRLHIRPGFERGHVHPQRPMLTIFLLPDPRYPSLSCPTCTTLLPWLQLQDFRSATTGVAAKAMRNELNNMVNGVSDPSAKKVRYSCLRTSKNAPELLEWCLVLIG